MVVRTRFRTTHFLIAKCRIECRFLLSIRAPSVSLAHSPAFASSFYLVLITLSADTHRHTHTQQSIIIYITSLSGFLLVTACVCVFDVLLGVVWFHFISFLYFFLPIAFRVHHHLLPLLLLLLLFLNLPLVTLLRIKIISKGSSNSNSRWRKKNRSISERHCLWPNAFLADSETNIYEAKFEWPAAQWNTHLFFHHRDMDGWWGWRRRRPWWW